MQEQDVGAPEPKTSKRIMAFDLMRGFFLLVILINHIELYPSGFDLFTGKGRLLVSAAEGFFFMSGMLVGIVYKRRLSLGMGFIFRKMWRRAAVLYIGSIVFTLLFTFLAFKLNHLNIKEGLYATNDWPSIFKDTVLMKYGYGWADFLDRFAILMLIAPFAFYLLSKGKWWLMLAASFIAWFFRGNNFILAWQIIFLLGMLAGYHWQAIETKLARLRPAIRRRLKLTLFSFTLITFAWSYACVYILSLLNRYLSQLPHGLQTLTYKWNAANQFVWVYSEKWTMGPFRILLVVAWFSVLFMLIRRYENRINKATRGIVELVGRNSLFVYITEAFIVFGFRLFIPAHTNVLQNFLITAASIVTLIGITKIYTRYINKPGRKVESSGGVKRPETAKS